MADVATVPGLDAVETPAYVYDLDEVRRSHRLLRDALPAPSRLYYSLKANPHPAIVAALRRAGCGAEVSSPGELAAAADAGTPASGILYTGPGKRDRDVAEAIDAGVRRFSVDSPVALDQIDRIAGGRGVTARCLIRVNDHAPAPGQRLTMTGVASQFGADAEWIEAEPERFASRPAARVVGFHLYMGSNLAGVEALLAQFTTAIATARRLADRCAVDVELVDLGGGFPAPFARAGALEPMPGLAGRLAELLDAAFPGWRRERPHVAFESGRYLAATAGCLLTRVLDVKRSHGRPVLVLESGINHLGGMSGLRRVPPVVPDVDAGAGVAALRDAMIAGPLCTPLDVWASSTAAPDARPGDTLRVPNVGAYGLSASL
ncbi:MAG TPA: type III PLP-dependent enzyme, partial [Candidatus Dormibacteraeota bacterium]|nr:type III PLP-dependent enzyme [Candidatus Dormibacteraeota bacterium]